ncbi:MAG: DUF2264 domain-containing protein [Gordonia sp. (in: high G+C Gram-positive bacteria)]
MQVCQRNLCARSYSDHDPESDGPSSKWGLPSDLYERFSRVTLVAALVDRGDHGGFESEVAAISRRVRVDVARQVDRSNPRSWWQLLKVRQSVVETGSLALAYLLSPDLLVDPDDAPTRQLLREWFVVNGSRWASANNWVLFPLLAQAAAAACDGTDFHADESVLQRVESWHVGDGWYTDGANGPIDYYSAWAFNFYLPLLEYLGLLDPDVYGFSKRCVRFAGHLENAIDPSGRPVLFGRSLLYRFGLVTPVGVAGLDRDLDAAALASLGALWRRCVDHFLDRGVVRDGTLSLGLYTDFDMEYQRYSGFGSAYWAFKSFVALLISPDSEFWGNSGKPSNAGEHVGGVSAAGITFGGAGSGVSTMYNHRNDSQKGRAVGWFADDPLYSRLSYSSATFPVTCTGLPDCSFGIAQGDSVSDRGAVQYLGGGDGWLQSRFVPGRRRRVLRSKLLRYGKLDFIGPRLKDYPFVVTHTSIFGAGGVVDIFVVSHDGEAGQGITHSGQLDIVATSWALPYKKEYKVKADSDARSLIVESDLGVATGVQALCGLSAEPVVASGKSSGSPLGEQVAMPIFRESAKVSFPAVYCWWRSVTSDGSSALPAVPVNADLAAAGDALNLVLGGREYSVSLHGPGVEGPRSAV